MKQIYPHIGLAKLCGWFGITRQAYYQNTWKASDVSIEESLILKEVREIRKKHSRMGVRKLHKKLQPFMLEHSIKMAGMAYLTFFQRITCWFEKGSEKSKQHSHSTGCVNIQI